jgi:hypothetical protein
VSGSRLVLSRGRAGSRSRAVGATVHGTRDASAEGREASRRMRQRRGQTGAGRVIDLEAYQNPQESGGIGSAGFLHSTGFTSHSEPSASRRLNSRKKICSA